MRAQKHIENIDCTRIKTNFTSYTNFINKKKIRVTRKIRLNSCKSSCKIEKLCAYVTMCFKKMSLSLSKSFVFAPQ